MKKRLGSLAPALLFLLPATVFADSGSTLRQYQDATILAPEKKEAEAIKYDDSGKAQESTTAPALGPEVHIERIHVAGQTVLSDEALHQVLAPYTGHALGTSEIHAAADALMAAIRKAGAFAARVYILPQDIIDGTVTFNVIEGHLAQDNAIVLGRSSERVKDDVIRRQLAHTLQPGSLITADKYERAIYLTNDLPGIKGSENLLFPAENVGEAGFESTVEDENLITGNLYYDNFGSTFTGRNRWGTAL